MHSMGRSIRAATRLLWPRRQPISSTQAGALCTTGGRVDGDDELARSLMRHWIAEKRVVKGITLVKLSGYVMDKSVLERGMEECHQQGLMRAVAVLFREYCKEVGGTPIRFDLFLLAVKAAVQETKVKAFCRAVEDFLSSHEHGGGMGGNSTTLDPQWWRPVLEECEAYPEMGALCAMEMVQEMRQRGLGVEGEVTTRVVKLLQERGLEDEAAMVLRSAAEDSTTTEGSASRSLAPLATADGVMREQRRALQKCVRHGRSNEALEIFKRLENEQGAGNVDEATYQQVIIACAADREKALVALELLGKMKGAGREPSATAYTSVILSLCQSRQADQAIQLYREMLDKGIQVPSVCGDRLIKLCARMNMVKEARQVLRDMTHRFDLIPALDAYKAITSCYDRQGATDKEIMEVYDSMNSRGVMPTMNIMNACLSGLAKVGRWDLCRKLFDDMKERKIHKDAMTYRVLLGITAKTHDAKEALRLLLEMQDLHITPTLACYAAAVTACGRAGHMEDALMLLRRSVQDVKPSRVVYAAAIDACARKGEMAMALTLMQEMEKKGIHGNAPAYGAAINGCVVSRQGDLAMDLLREMRVKGMRPGEVAYSAAMMAQSSDDKFERVLELFEEMKAQKISVIDPCYGVTIKAAYILGKYELCVDLCKEMMDAGMVPVPEQFRKVMTACANHLPPTKEHLDLLDLAIHKGVEVCATSIRMGVVLATKLEDKEAIERLSKLYSSMLTPPLATTRRGPGRDRGSAHQNGRRRDRDGMK